MRAPVCLCFHCVCVSCALCANSSGAYVSLCHGQSEHGVALAGLHTAARRHARFVVIALINARIVSFFFTHSFRLRVPPVKSDPIRRQDRARDNRAMRTVAKQPHLYMPLPTPSTNCSCPRLQEKDLCFRGMMLVKRLMCFSILFKTLFMLSLDCVNN